MAGFLVISPHVDDEALGCGGVIDERFHVHYCGIEAFRIVSQEERIQEARDCAKHLGFTFSINFENPVKEYREEVLIGQFEELINQHRPHTLFAPYPSFNQDHRAVHDAALIATRPHDTNHDVSNVLLYEQVHVSLWPYTENNLRGLTFHPAYFVPIDIERKLEAYRLHASQVRGMRSPESVQTLARWRGYQSGFDYAEGFQVLRLKDPRRLALGLLKSEEETS
jgi:LmbE family N-acetylglucosaminyl deacetylase